MNRPNSTFTLNGLALAVAAALPCSAALAQSGFSLEEVVVTATKRSASAQDVPINLSSTSGEDLRSQGIVDLSKFVRTIPGISRVDSGARNPSPMAIRGLSVDELSANDGGSYGGTVSTYIGDTPLLIDLKMKDLERIEVLRGPQGTLYGAGAMGGTIRYIVNKPDLQEFSATFNTAISTTKESSGLSSDTDFMVNMPLIEDKLALRVVGGHVDQKGYIDNDFIIAGADDDIDNERTDFARAALMWAPTDTLDMTFSYYFQDQNAGGRQAVNPNFAGDKYSASTRYQEPLARELDLYTFEANWDLGFATLSSSTSYYEISELGNRDQTDLLTVAIWPGYLNYPEFSAFTEEQDEDEYVVQEIRLASNSEGDLEWILGAYYTNENIWSLSQEFTPGYPEFIGLNRPDDLEYYEEQWEDNEETAFFGELTYHITDAWQITAGARKFDLQQDTKTCLAFPIYDNVAGTDIPVSCSVGGGENKDSFFKLNTSYDIDEDKMVYFTWAEGFRRGGANGVPVGGQVDIPSSFLSYAPDTVTNWEIGAKTAWLDNRVRVNGSLFYIEWEGVQLGTTTPVGSIPVTVNGDDARSQGVELEVQAMATENLALTFSAAYTDAELAEDTVSTPEVDGHKGDDLPGVPRTTFFLGMDYTWGLENGYDLIAHADASYKGSIESRLNSNQTNQLDPSLGDSVNQDNESLDSYTLANMSLTLQADQWNTRLFIDNVLDEYAYTGVRGARKYGDQGAFYYLTRPRTVGVAFSYDF